MGINRALLKSNAKAAISGARPSPILVGAVAIVISYLLSYLYYQITGLSAFYDAYYGALFSGTDPTYALANWRYPVGFVPVVLQLAISIISYMISCGFTIYALNASRARPAGFGTLFDSFGIFFKLIGLSIVTGFFVFAWSLLFIIPGIIAAYRYRLALYILIDNPQWSVMDCINMSKRMMAGRKGELFVLDLSFIGWRMLTSIPFVSLWVLPYTSLTYANYFNARLHEDGIVPPPIEQSYGA